MRWSQLSNKEIVDLHHGERLGTVGETDMVFDEATGIIDRFLLSSSGFLGLGKKQETITIPLSSIRKVGVEMMIIELEQRQKMRGSSS